MANCGNQFSSLMLKVFMVVVVLPQFHFFLRAEKLKKKHNLDSGTLTAGLIGLKAAGT